MHALVNSYGVWKKKAFLSFGCRISQLKYFPTPRPSLQFSTGIYRAQSAGVSSHPISTRFHLRWDQAGWKANQPSPTGLGSLCKARSLLQIIAHERVGFQRGSGLLRPQPSQLVFNSHTTCVFRSVAQSLPYRTASFLFQNEWLHRCLGWALTFLRCESKYLVREICHPVCEDWE